MSSFCITHLAQIASLSDNHYVVSKKIENDKTYSHIKMIGDEEKVSEIAKMIGGRVLLKEHLLVLRNLLAIKIIRIKYAQNETINRECICS